MIAGSTVKGICLLEWHSRGGVDRIRERISKRHGLPVAEGTNPHIDLLEQNLGDYFEGVLHKFTVPLDLCGTAFEMAVWQQLLEIPYGETRSYAELATAVGSPRGFRAVGRANGANCVSIVVPCHRVIESTGKLRGYGGGLWRKKFLLELEQRGVILARTGSAAAADPAPVPGS